VGTQHFDAEGVVLSVAAFLRVFGAEEGGDVEEFCGLGFGVEGVFEVGADGACGAVGF
jgi:hypothetical protein